MSKEDIIAMAREAGANGLRPYSKRLTTEPIVAFRMAPEQLERFADLVAAKEREACAHLCDEICAVRGVPFYGLPGMKGSAQECAAAIRARGKP